MTFPAVFELSSLNVTNGFTISGIYPHSASGASVSNAGDINADGIDDLIIGAPSYHDRNILGSNVGKSYVIFGKQGVFSSNIDLSSLNGNNGFVLNGINIGDQTGVSVSNAGDINADGIGDLIIGANTAQPDGIYRQGQSYVIFGKNSVFSSEIDLSSLNGNNGFYLNGFDSGGVSGESISNAGDINADGIDDIIIGAQRASPNGKYRAGQSYVIFGKDDVFSTTINLSSLNGNNGFIINGVASDDRTEQVSNAGDINADGIDDLIIGAWAADPNGKGTAGRAYVVFGKNDVFSPTLELSSLNGNNGFIINGLNTQDRLGQSVSNAGDINADGYPDLFICTAGEQRISNFLIWQMAYTEFYFTDVYWPEFDEQQLHKALHEYGQRKRKFGLTQEQIEAGINA